jgi:hypothetical protein
MNRLFLASTALLAASMLATIPAYADPPQLPGLSLGAVGGYDSGPQHTTTSPAAASHAAGVSVGGLITIPLGRSNGGSGIITSLLAWTSWGSTQTYVVRVWNKNPTNTTCADNAAFASSTTDDAYLIGAGPVSISFAAPQITTGDAKTYAPLTNLSWDYKNADGTSTQNLYACLQTVAADVPGASATLSLSLSGPQN